MRLLRSSVVLLAIMVGCSQSAPELKSEIELLTLKKQALETEVNKSRSHLNYFTNELAQFKNRNVGKPPKYILTIELKQKHYLDFSKMIKDEFNKAKVELPVDEEFYKQVVVGKPLLEEFRVGSAVMEGSFGEWVLTVKDKRIE